MEHLGLKHNLADPRGPILPRDAVKREDVVGRLFTCPGTIQVRSKLATAFVRPLEDWASPFMSPGSQDQVKSLFRAITHASTKWWCYGRAWCQQVENHPAFGVAIRGLCNGRGLLSSASGQLSAALARHASVLCLRVVRTTPQSLWVKTTRPPASFGIPLRDGLATFNQDTQIDVDNCGHGSDIRHALRTRARRMLLSRINRTRFDCEGVEDIDVDCTSHKVWCDWIKLLSPPDTTALCIWRIGAIWTPTRRYHRSRAPQPELTVRLCAPFVGTRPQAPVTSGQIAPDSTTRGASSNPCITWPPLGGSANLVAPANLVGSLARLHARLRFVPIAQSLRASLASAFTTP